MLQNYITNGNVGSRRGRKFARRRKRTVEWWQAGTYVFFLYFHFMKRQNDQPLKEVIAELLQSYHLKEKMNEVRLVQHWEELFGKTISKYTDKMFVNNKKLYLNISSAPLRQELMYSKDKMVERINEAIEKDFIREVVIR